MDKNTIIGIVLIVAIILGFGIINKPSEEQLARQRAYNDSIALVQQEQQKLEQTKLISEKLQEEKNESEIENTTSDEKLADMFGAFSNVVKGAEKLITIENDLQKITFSNKGGRIYSVELKKYKTHDSLPLTLFEKDESSFNYVLTTNNNRVINSSELYFQQIGEVEKDTLGNQKLTLRLNTTEPDAYIDFVYTIPSDSYLMRYDMKAHNMNRVMPLAINSLELNWKSKIRQQEMGEKFENRYTSVYYKYKADDDVEKLNESKNDLKKIDNQVKWVAFKDQFFSTIYIADNEFTSTVLNSRLEKEGGKYLKDMEADVMVDFDVTGQKSTGFNIYIGPNQYKIFTALDRTEEFKDNKLYLRKIIPLGGSIISWVNRIIIIPTFNFLNNYIGNYGIIILLLTLFIKTLLLPFTYKSYMSSAKMRVLQPEIQEIHSRIPADKTMERQQATMALYKKVGVSPMGGCLPMLLQMPILIAMYNFFPASIELRQQSFLWVADLSTYDSLISWNGNIPIISSILGNHISLFTLLMTITNIFSTKLSQATTNQMSADQPGAGMMKWMMYLMPVMFFFMFNNYSAALSYYFFLSSLITIIQTYAIRATVNEEKLLAQLRAKGKQNEKNPKKRSGFMARLEKMQQEQQRQMQQKNRKK